MDFLSLAGGDGVTRGVFVSTGSPVVAGVVGGAGFDWAMLDMEHGLGDEGALFCQIAALAGTGTAPLVRVPALRGEWAKRALDAGAAGLMLPLANSGDEARRFAESMRYPPDGARGLFANCRAGGFGRRFEDYFARANRDLVGIAQIETREGVAAADAIAAVPGIDVLFVGHSDLSLALGCRGAFTAPAVREAEQVVLDAVRRHGKRAGMLLRPGMRLEEETARGYSFIALGEDTTLLRQGCDALLRPQA